MFPRESVKAFLVNVFECCYPTLSFACWDQTSKVHVIFKLALRKTLIMLLQSIYIIQLIQYKCSKSPALDLKTSVQCMKMDIRVLLQSVFCEFQ